MTLKIQICVQLDQFGTIAGNYLPYTLIQLNFRLILSIFAIAGLGLA